MSRFPPLSLPFSSSSLESYFSLCTDLSVLRLLLVSPARGAVLTPLPACLSLSRFGCPRWNLIGLPPFTSSAAGQVGGWMVVPSSLDDLPAALDAPGMGQNVTEEWPSALSAKAIG